MKKFALNFLLIIALLISVFALYDTFMSVLSVIITNNINVDSSAYLFGKLVFTALCCGLSFLLRKYIRRSGLLW